MAPHPVVDGWVQQADHTVPLMLALCGACADHLRMTLQAESAQAVRWGEEIWALVLMTAAVSAGIRQQMDRLVAQQLTFPF